MKSIVEINYNELRQFEESVEANVKVGGYGMDKISPIEEGKCFKIILEAEDINRIFLLKEPTFTNFTVNRNFMIADITEKVDEVERVKYWLDRGLDLRNAPEWSPVFVSTALVGVRANETNHQRTNVGGDANISISTIIGCSCLNVILQISLLMCNPSLITPNF